MEEQKNILIAVLLCIVLWLGMEVWFKPSSPPPPVTSKTLSAHNESVSFIKRSEALLLSSRIPIHTSRVKGSINLKGARVDDWVLMRYRDTWHPDSPHVVLFSPDHTREAYYAFFGWHTQIKNIDLPHHDTLWQANTNQLTEKTPLTLQWKNAQGILFQQIFSLESPYVLTIQQVVTNTMNHTIALSTSGSIFRQGPIKTSGYLVLHEGPIGVFSGKLKELSYQNSLEEKTFENLGKSKEGIGWSGFTDQYFLSALLPQGAAQGRFGGTENPLIYHNEIINSDQSILPQHSATSTTRLFAGPKELSLLDHYEKTLSINHFDLAVDFGWFYFLTKPMFYILSWLKGIGGSFGFAIIAMTFLIKGAFLPLSLRSYRSTAKIKKLQPKLQAIKEKYAHNRMMLNQEMMSFYKKEKINPVSGCLPMLIQIPVFFSLYKVLFISIEMRQEPFWGWIHDLAAPDPTNLFNGFGLISLSLPGWCKIGAWPLLMGMTMILQQRMNTSVMMDTQQKVMFTYVMPLIFTFMLAQFPVGLVIYWTWSNILTIVQQWFMVRYYKETPVVSSICL